MQIGVLQPEPNSRLAFQQSQFHRVPRESGCYVLATFDDHILYLGKTNNLKRRFNEHLQNPDKLVKTERGIAFWFYYLQSENPDCLERTWLNHYRSLEGGLPVFNKIDSPIG